MVGRTLLNDDAGGRACHAGEKYAIIVHGWKENCDAEWISFLVSSRLMRNTRGGGREASVLTRTRSLSVDLTMFRGGCIMCMDYGRYADKPYVRLYRDFNSLAEVLAGKLRQLERGGFRASSAFIFGFSYGGRLALEASQRFGPKKINQIDSESAKAVPMTLC